MSVFTIEYKGQLLHCACLNFCRVVLMSATADIARYRDYFKDLGRGERVEVLAIPSTNQKTVFDRRVLYLEQVFMTVPV